MNYTISEVLNFVEENDVKFIRLAFCDIFGNQKNISIMPSELQRAFEKGISFDASAIDGFMDITESDLILVPDASTLSILPWRPTHGRVVRLFCNITYPNGNQFEGDGRFFLKTAFEKCKEKGLICKIGSECEFYLFELDENGNPTYKPQDNAGYCDIAPLDKAENVRREICLTLEEMGIMTEASHHEQGPGQNEIDFKYNNADKAADELITFKSVVKTIAARNGLFASFFPKPFYNKSGSGLHINISLNKNGLNIFKNSTFEHSQEAESFIAGILDKITEMTIFLNPLTNSYKRFGSFKAPKYVSWSHENRSQLIRIPYATGEYSRMELRSPDSSCNPYLAFALLIYAGLEGIENNMPLPKPSNINMYNKDIEKLKEFVMLPENLNDAVKLSCKSDFIQNVLPEKIFNSYIKIKKNEWNYYIQSSDKEKCEREMYLYI